MRIHVFHLGSHTNILNFVSVFGVLCSSVTPERNIIYSHNLIFASEGGLFTLILLRARNLFLKLIAPINKSLNCKISDSWDLIICNFFTHVWLKEYKQLLSIVCNLATLAPPFVSFISIYLSLNLTKTLLFLLFHTL